MNQRYDFFAISFLLFAVVLTVWLGLWGPIVTIDFKDLNNSSALAAWVQAFVAGLAMVVVYLAATIPARRQEVERATERRLRAQGLALLLLPDILVLKGEIEDCIQNKTIYDIPVVVSDTLMDKTDQLYLMGETGGRLLQAIGMVNGVAAQTRRFQAAATVNGVPIQSRAGVGVPIWQNNVSTLQLCLMNFDEAIDRIQDQNF
jgi:hypothetical protein